MVQPAATGYNGAGAATGYADGPNGAGYDNSGYGASNYADQGGSPTRDWAGQSAPGVAETVISPFDAVPDLDPAPSAAQSGTPRPFGRLSIYTLLDDKTEEFDRLAEEAAEGVRTSEPDTLVYVIHVVPKAPMQRIIYEIYRNRSAFESHERQPHIQRFERARESCVVATNIIDLRLRYAKVAALFQGDQADEAASQQAAAGAASQPGESQAGYERGGYQQAGYQQDRYPQAAPSQAAQSRAFQPQRQSQPGQPPVRSPQRPAARSPRAIESGARPGGSGGGQYAGPGGGNRSAAGDRAGGGSYGGYGAYGADRGSSAGDQTQNYHSQDYGQRAYAQQGRDRGQDRDHAAQPASAQSATEVRPARGKPPWERAEYSPSPYHGQRYGG
jgi:quinol monooxygenase YgiN